MKCWILLAVKGMKVISRNVSPVVVSEVAACQSDRVTAMCTMFCRLLPSFS